MGKVAFLFPGQGAQKIGMGRDFYESFESVRDIYNLAGDATGLDVAKLCFEENEQLDITEYTQAALLTTEVAILKVIQDKGIKADYCAGLSLGEYGCLAAAEVMELTDLFKVIRKRGIYMQNAYPQGGAMMAVLGLDAETIAKICKETEGIVSIANDNCPGQIVITGEASAVARAGESLSAAGAKRTVPLKVSGPFHSPLLKTAGEQLAAELADITVHEIKIPYICNVNAEVVTDANEVKELLALQVCSQVRFRESILLLKELGVTTFVEIGPGKTLAGFIKKTDKELSVINVSSVADLEKLDVLM